VFVVTRRMLRYAPRFHRIFFLKKAKKKFQKKILKIFREIFFSIFFVYRGFTANLGCACENLGGLGPLILKELDPAQTIVNPKLKFIYRSADSKTGFHY
jgi:hypothetical protein